MEELNNPDNDEALDAILREHLTAELNPQLGKAADRFRHHLRGDGLVPRRAWGGWVVGIVGGAMAASIAALWAGPSLWPTRATGPGRGGTPVVPVADYRFDLDDVTLLSRTRDGGTVLLDGRTPARRIVRDELRQVRWVDPAHDATVEQIVPHRDVMLIEMDTY
jgi:hypothetical protein